MWWRLVHSIQWYQICGCISDIDEIRTNRNGSWVTAWSTEVKIDTTMDKPEQIMSDCMINRSEDWYNNGQTGTDHEWLHDLQKWRWIQQWTNRNRSWVTAWSTEVKMDTTMDVPRMHLGWLLPKYIVGRFLSPIKWVKQGHQLIRVGGLDGEHTLIVSPEEDVQKCLKMFVTKVTHPKSPSNPNPKYLLWWPRKTNTILVQLTE